jgi:SAM-dependent methyltransferase
VVLADLSATLLDTARLKFAEADVAANIDAIDEIDARDLGRYPDGRFDAVVAFGLYYHLTSPDERASATREIHRVLGPGGLAFIAFIPRLSGLAALLDRAANFPAQVPSGTLSKVAATGVFHNGAQAGFQEGYYADPFDLREQFEADGFSTVEVVSLRSIA